MTYVTVVHKMPQLSRADQNLSTYAGKYSAKTNDSVLTLNLC